MHVSKQNHKTYLKRGTKTQFTFRKILRELAHTITYHSSLIYAAIANRFADILNEDGRNAQLKYSFRMESLQAEHIVKFYIFEKKSYCS